MRGLRCIACSLGILILATACGKDHPAKPREKGWFELGLGDSRIFDLELAWPYLYAAAGGGGLSRTGVSNDRSTWELLGFDDDFCYTVTVLENGRILAGSRSGLHRSDDSGHSWAPCDSELTGRITCLARCCDALLASGGDPGLFKSVDDGLSWSRIIYMPYLYQYAIACHPVQCDFIMMTIEGNRMWGALLVSHDSGETWDSPVLSTQSPYIRPRGIAFDPNDDRIAYVGTERTVLRTNDSGVTWTPIIPPDEDQQFEPVVIDPENRHTIYAGGQGFIYQINLGAIANERVVRIESPTDEQITELVFSDRDHVIYVGTASGVYEYVY